jgi:hypothetical protein
MAEGAPLAGIVAKSANWLQLAAWAKNRDDFDRKERAFMRSMIDASAKGTGLSPKQHKWVKDMWAKAAKAGFAVKD